MPEQDARSAARGYFHQHTNRPLGSHIRCLACGGKGYMEQRDYRGLPYPMRCQACNGTGTQRVAS